MTEKIDTRILFVGESRCRRSHSELPRGGSPTMRRFDRIIDRLGLRFVAFTNLSSSHVSKLTRSAIDVPIGECAKYHSRVVALGSSASAALNELGIAHLRIPHPSPRCRHWNDPRAEDRVAQSIRNFMQKF